MNPTGTVVVGVDGSPESRAALEFALRDAARRQAWLKVVTAAQLPEYWTIDYAIAAMPSAEEVIADTNRIARQTVDEVVNDHPELAAVNFTVEAAAGPAGPVLVDASEEADLLVLGHRGRGADAADVMATDVISAEPQDSFAQVASLLRGAAVRAVPVFDPDGATGPRGVGAKVFGWYDNEWGYAQRTIDLVEMVARTLPDR